MIAIQRELFSLAERGELLIESEDFVNYLISYSHEESLHELTGKCVIFIFRNWKVNVSTTYRHMPYSFLLFFLLIQH